MAAAGFIPIVGWAGRAVKGGSAVYKTVKGLNAADHALDAYKSSKGLDVLKQTEYGLYGLTAANGLGEAVTGKDMFGNELTDEQRQNSLMNALGIAGVAGAAKVADKMASGTKFIPYSKEFVQNQVQKAQDSIKDMGKAIGKVEVPTGVKVRAVADTTGNTYKSIGVDKTTIKDLAQKITAKGEGIKGTGEAVKGARYGERKVSNETYAKLRRASPSSKIQKEVNKDIDNIIGTEDFALPGKIIDKKLHADHIVSLDKISKMEGFEKLSYNEQKEIANYLDNFIGLSEAANTSKGSKSFAEWKIYKKENILVNPEFSEKMILKEKELEHIIQQLIDGFNEINKKE